MGVEWELIIYIYLIKFPGLLTIRIYMVIELYLHKKKWLFVFPAPSGGRRPLEVIYIYLIKSPGLRTIRVYVDVCCISTNKEVIFLPGTFRRETPFGSDI